MHAFANCSCCAYSGIRPFNRALYEAFLLNFQTLLSEGSRSFMNTFLKQSLYNEPNAKDQAAIPSRPGGRTSTAADWVLVKPFWLRAGPLAPVDWAEKDASGVTRFVLTKTVESNIRSLAAAVGAQVAPVLIQVNAALHPYTLLSRKDLTITLSVVKPLCRVRRVSARPRWWSILRRDAGISACASITTSTPTCRSTSVGM